MDITEGTIWFACQMAAELVTAQETTNMFALAWKITFESHFREWYCRALFKS